MQPETQPTLYIFFSLSRVYTLKRERGSFRLSSSFPFIRCFYKITLKRNGNATESLKYISGFAYIISPVRIIDKKLLVSYRSGVIK